MNNTLTIQSLTASVSGSAAAYRCRTRLQPAGGVGEKIFPPTYEGAVYATEKRQVPDAEGKLQTVDCVLLDSVPAQANRMEEALQAALDSGRINVPVISVDFTGEKLLDEVGRITSLEAPHRVADAILRDSLHHGQAFRESDVGKHLESASLQNATPLYRLCPTALIYGVWDSTGKKKSLGVKIQRALVSEIIGVNAHIGKKTESRIDPLGMRAAAKIVKIDGSYELAANEKTPGAISPSGVNHGNITPSIRENGGATIDYAEQTIVLSLPALRRLRFPVDGVTTLERDIAGRTVLVALALAAAALAAETGFDLRSRCLLWPTGPLVWELLAVPGQEPEKLTITSEHAISLLQEAVAAAEKAGLKWHSEPIILKPAPNLIALLKRSQEIAAASPTENTGN